MKSFISILSVFFSLTTFSQLDNFIVNAEGLWSNLSIHCVPSGNEYSTYSVKFQDDTIIDGYTYQKIWRCDEENLANWTFYGFIRENENHQVYLKPPDYIEGLIYDFGVNVGDSIQALNVYLSSSNILNFVVVQVDSVLLLDRYRKRISLFEYMNNKEEIWVEGLGSYSGILNSCNNAYGGLCGGSEALCYKENDNLAYQNPDFETCYYSALVGLNQTKLTSFKASPNPTKDFITINFPTNSERRVEICDFSGKKVLNNLFFEKNILLNLQEVDNGIYIINVFDDKNYYLPYKLIVD